MIESFLLDKYYKKENFNGKDQSIITSFSSIIGLVFSIIALYLSWSCNTSKGISLIPKIIYGFFAFIFGLFYIILYFLFLRDC